MTGGFWSIKARSEKGEQATVKRRVAADWTI
jgi:hypothetical protein